MRKYIEQWKTTKMFTLSEKKSIEFILSVIIENKINEVSEFYIVDELIEERTGRKETLIKTWVAFLGFLKEKGLLFDSIFFHKVNIQNREIELVKFLHEPRTIKDIQAKFGVNERTIRLEREKLRDGIDFMGYKIKLDEKRDKNTFQLSTEDNLFVSTAHPFVLVLNLSQVYQLTILLLDSVKDNNILYDNYLLYANIIYSQLSEYATKIIDEANKNKHPLKKHFNLEFISEQNMFNENKNREFWYLKKIDEFADITYFNGKEIISNKLKPYNTKDDVLLFIDKDNNILELIATNIMNYSNIPGY